MKRTFNIANQIRSMSIRNKIISFYLTLVLASVLFSVFFYYETSNRYLDRTIYELSINEVQTHNRSLELLMEDINTYSKEIISSPSIQTTLDPDQEQIYRLKQVDQELAASMMFDSKISSVYVFDFDGKKYFRDKQVFKNIQLEDILAKDWYRDLVELRGGYLYNFNGDGLIQDEDYDYLCFFRIINSNVDHEPVGIMMITIEDDTMKAFFNIADVTSREVILREMTYGTEIRFGGSASAGKEGTHPLDNSDILEPMFSTIATDRLYYEEVPLDNQNFILTGMMNDKYDWMIAESRTDMNRTSRINTFNIAIIIIIALNSLIIIYGSIFISGYITTPLVTLTKSMKAVEEGTFIPVEANRHRDEIGSLQEGYNYMIIEIQRLIDKVIHEQQIIKNAELRVIMEQIKPHFMYNTLDSISSLIMLGRHDDANMALSALAKFYRNSLSDGRSEVTLETEIDIIRNYLLIQNIRYKDMFEVSYEIEEGLLNIKVPKLMLQPLVENSFYHGIRPLGMDGLIKVRAYKKGAAAVVEVEDNGMGIGEEAIERVFREADDIEGNMTSIGLPATIRRIHHMYEGKSLVHIENSEVGTVIRIELSVLGEGV